jgi:hypothetical protein
MPKGILLAENVLFLLEISCYLLLQHIPTSVQDVSTSPKNKYLLNQ